MRFQKAYDVASFGLLLVLAFEFVFSAAKQGKLNGHDLFALHDANDLLGSAFLTLP